MTATATRWTATADDSIMKARTFTPGEAMTPENVLREAGLDWTVDLSPIHYFTPDGPRELPGKSVIYRTDTGEGFAPVGTSSYRPFQNRELVDLACLTLAESGEALRIDTAGYHGIGARVFVNVAMPTDLNVEGDKMATSVIFHTRHDGGGAITAALMFRRMYCSNQINVALRNKTFAYKIRHTSGAASHVDDVRRALKLVPQGMERFEAEVRELMRIEVSTTQAAKIAVDLFHTDTDTDQARRNSARRVEQLMATYTSDRRVGPYVGTAWGFTQAVSTWEQHVVGNRTAAQREARAHLAVMDQSSLYVDRLARIIGEHVPALAA